MSNSTIEALQKRLAYRFRDTTLLRQALTHRSAGVNHNERLEFLGDSVLGVIIAHELFCRYEMASEGELTRCRSRLVRKQTLAVLANELDLESVLIVGQAIGRNIDSERSSILSDALEAIIGAVLMDGGYTKVAGVVKNLFSNLLDQVVPDAGNKDAKTELQELLQKRGFSLPVYEVTAIHGQPHARQFDVNCRLQELNASYSGRGTSRRQAEQDAATKALAACA